MTDDRSGKTIRALRSGSVSVALASALLTAALPLRVHAAAPARTHVAMTTVTFRLHVVGQPAPGTTFWVAYGPLAGHWGIVQLHSSSAGWYTASHALPVQGKSVFTYLTGHGVAHAKVGDVPGNPVVKFRDVGPATAAAAGHVAATWYQPVG